MYHHIDAYKSIGNKEKGKIFYNKTYVYRVGSTIIGPTDQLLTPPPLKFKRLPITEQKVNVIPRND